MTTIPGTHFTEEQLESALKVDNVSYWGLAGSWKMNNIGYKYKNEKKQYDKALAWYILAAKKNDSAAQSNIGVLYYHGLGVPKNYLCALKWCLKSAEGNNIGNTAYSIGRLFENGYGVPLDKNKALEWYHHDKDKTDISRLKGQGFYLLTTDKKKSLIQLIKETEVILDAEKRKLEEKPDKTLEEMETLEQLNITYKLVDGGKNAWDYVPILLAYDKKHSVKSVNSYVTNNKDEILELKKQIQLLKQNNFDGQPKQLESLKEKDKELVSLKNVNQSLQRGNSTVQHQIETNDSKITSLKSENQELQQKINNLERQNMSFQIENHSLKHRIDECKQQKKTKDDQTNLLESEKGTYHSTPIQQTQALKALEQEKITMERDKANITNEMERLKECYATLEQLLKSKEDTIASLDRENQMLSTVNQGHQQGANDMVETLKNLLQGKTNEIELLKQNMEHLLTNEQRRNDTLEQENRMLKQERAQQQVTVQTPVPLNNNINHTNINASQHDQHDDSYNDLNYESEYSDSDIEEGDADDINYDTPSEDEDSNNDLNYDDIKQSNK